MSHNSDNSCFHSRLSPARKDDQHANTCTETENEGQERIQGCGPFPREILLYAVGENFKKTNLRSHSVPSNIS